MTQDNGASVDNADRGRIMGTCSGCRHLVRCTGDYSPENRCENPLVEYTYHEVKPETVLQIEPDEGWGMFIHKPDVFGCTLFEERQEPAE